ncbi:class F sortase [Streptomyces sp. NPDC087422]|uniref:class F sortase n=1 Tax=Streptomyces sp. NPDC087422 TaxID=3365786 RepID=UPI003805F83C
MAPRHARPRPRHRGAAGALAVLGVVTVAGGAVGLAANLGTRPGSGHARAAVGAVAPEPGRVVSRPVAPTEATAARPRALAIPAIDVDTPLEPLGLTPSGALDTPSRPSRAGWFDAGPVPGAPGPAVLVGHVDSPDGPAVFSRLSLLRVNDVIRVTLDDNRTVRFQVTSVRSYAKDAFPTEAVYAPRPDPQLRLITCGGRFTGHTYLDNIVVFARLLP